MEHTIATSGDGSNTLQLTRFNETYHSRNGAYTEAQHIYIKCGVEYLYTSTSSQCINIFDVGMGTALNCILTWVWQQLLVSAGKPCPKIKYWGIEKYPIKAEEIELFNYPQIIAQHTCLPTEKLAKIFNFIHNSSWEKDIILQEGDFILHKVCGDIKTINEEFYRKAQNNNSCLTNTRIPSVIFYDTFSPATQPELWDEAIFRTIAGGCASGSRLVTYCSKGSVKQALRSAGFTLERLAGPPGKRHILRATL